jgi:predicted transcriptional regulator YdeE
VVGKSNETVYCVYFNYKNADSIDARSYDMLIGFETGDEIVQTDPEITTITVPEQNYKYETVKGEMPKVLIEQWAKVNGLTMGELERSFGYDMDIYSDDGAVTVAVAVH